jgi:hypothetical protein
MMRSLPSSRHLEGWPLVSDWRIGPVELEELESGYPLIQEPK